MIYAHRASLRLFSFMDTCAALGTEDPEAVAKALATAAIRAPPSAVPESSPARGSSSSASQARAAKSDARVSSADAAAALPVD